MPFGLTQSNLHGQIGKLFEKPNAIAHINVGPTWVAIRICLWANRPKSKVSCPRTFIRSTSFPSDEYTWTHEFLASLSSFNNNVDTLIPTQCLHIYHCKVSWCHFIYSWTFHMFIIKARLTKYKFLGYLQYPYPTGKHLVQDGELCQSKLVSMCLDASPRLLYASWLNVSFFDCQWLTFLM